MFLIRLCLLLVFSLVFLAFLVFLRFGPPRQDLSSSVMRPDPADVLQKEHLPIGSESMFYIVGKGKALIEALAPPPPTTTIPTSPPWP